MFGRLLTISSIFLILSCAVGDKEVAASFEVEGMDVRNGFL